MQGRSVLVVDDDGDYRQILDVALSHAGYLVRTAADRPHALSAARSVRLDLIVLSVGMPGVDGWALARRLKADPATGRIPILAVTGKNAAGSARALKGAGFCGQLVRPFLPRQAVEAVRLCLEDCDSGGVWATFPAFDLPPPPAI